MQMPIVVEQNFRENFSIASATPAYERLLAAAPGEFAGSVSRLAAIVELLSEGVKRAFAEQGLPLPPWRRAKSVMSKWGMGPNAHGVTPHLATHPPLTFHAHCITTGPPGMSFLVLPSVKMRMGAILALSADRCEW